jgi:hypothetical protein
LVIISQFSGAVENGQLSVGIAMDSHLDPDVMAAILICGDLKLPSLEADTVVGADCPFVLLAEDVIEISPDPRDKR